MTQLKLIYNPYKAKTDLYFKINDDWEPVDHTSKFIGMLRKPIYKWLHSDENNLGFFDQLALFGDNKYEIYYYGLKKDFDELVCAADLFRKETPKEAPQILLHFMHSDEQQLTNGLENKINKLEKLYQQSRTFPYVMESEIPELLGDAISKEIEIGVIALLSAGKSTLINALLGKRIFPTASEAKTAVISRIVIDPAQEKFTARCRKREGNWETVPGTINRERMEELNDLTDAGTGQSVWKMIEVRGPAFRSKTDLSPRFNQTLPQIIFTDTPGINNAQNYQHKELTEQLLSKGNQNLLIFLFTAESFQTDDTKHLLESIINIFPNTDRIIFVCNRADEITMSYQDQYNQLAALLRGYGIHQPNLFLTCAKAAELTRIYQYDSECENEEDWDYFTADESNALDAYRKKFTKQTEPKSAKFVKNPGGSTLDPALYHFSSLSKFEKLKFDEQVTKLQGSKTEEAELQIMLLNSGVPALEYFIANYIERQAVPIKLQHLSEVMTQKDVRALVYNTVEVELGGYIKEAEQLEQDLAGIDREMETTELELSRIKISIDRLNSYLTSGNMLKEQLHQRTERAKKEYSDFYQSISVRCHHETKTVYVWEKYGIHYTSEFLGISIYEAYACAQSCICYLYKAINSICSDVKQMAEQGESFYREIWKYDCAHGAWYQNSGCYSALTKDVESEMKSYLQKQAGCKTIDTSMPDEQIYSSLSWVRFRGASFDRIDEISRKTEHYCVDRGYKIFPPFFTFSEIRSETRDGYDSSLAKSLLGSVKQSYGFTREAMSKAGVSTRYKWISWDLVEFIPLWRLDEEVNLILNGMPWYMCEKAGMELDQMFFESREELHNNQKRLEKEKNRLEQVRASLTERRDRIRLKIESLQTTLKQMTDFFKEIESLFEI